MKKTDQNTPEKRERRGGRRKGSGRPKSRFVLSKEITVIVGDDVYRYVKKTAKAEKISVSKWCRRLILNERERAEKNQEI